MTIMGTTECKNCKNKIDWWSSIPNPNKNPMFYEGGVIPKNRIRINSNLHLGDNKMEYQCPKCGIYNEFECNEYETV